MNKDIEKFYKARKAVEDAESKLSAAIGVLSRTIKELTDKNIVAMLVDGGEIEYRISEDEDGYNADMYSFIAESEVVECIKDKNYEPFVLED